MATAIQIYCRRPSLSEMASLMDMGIELLGWDLRPADGDALMHSRMMTKEIQARGRKATLLVHSTKGSVLQTVAELVRPDFLLLSANRDDSLLPVLGTELQKVGTALMIPIPVGLPGNASSINSIAIAMGYEQFAGCFTVDTCPNVMSLASFGCTGQTNDWDVAAQVVAQVETPVIMAGGLRPDNVADAIRRVHPFGVDACTSLERPDRSKDLARCQAFVTAVRDVDRQLVALHE